MSISFDVVIASDDYSVDMNSGLDTLKGASEATRQIATTILEERVPERLSSESKVRTNLKKSFKGSFGQQFSIDIYDVDVQKRLNKIGKKAFVELISYFINEALYQESLELSPKAKKVLKDLGVKLEEKLIKQLQRSSLDHLHTVSNNFNQDVKLRYRQSRDKQTTLAKVDRATHATLKPRTDRTKRDITASITRLNINTGNGRLQIQGADETVAFGFPVTKKYLELKVAAKTPFSENLHTNNSRPREEWETLQLRVHTQTTSTGRVIKYIIEGIVDA
ncbi:hypothetical protein ACSTKO_08860 [Vibrio parahaemolyticus]|uniref:hypothetical protein n=1 Tax=unclassified Vibrio TaxID=2614977 RepID=UPI00202AEC27|nr:MULTISPECIES: hypothetical protein [unclassified Vibrio]ELN6883740.1 hypothetical protein [Vibrio alginolyticus]MDG2603100.1 hypothetical protein [Vibrio parahaemolyticus]MDW3166404.1 hypothetical protein [Vibrio sp. Y184]URQ96800.1 hypothetical protein J4N40_16950 [Vibrio sp. SCSIO 43097]HBN6272923.1 hypothetical protein [Vibrio parahaemolyticus]